MPCCANPTTEPTLQDLADAVGAPTAVRMERRVFIALPADDDGDVEDLKSRFRRAVEELDYRIPH
jgi:hypothetical protein